jgi:hypothetical protein
MDESHHVTVFLRRPYRAVGYLLLGSVVSVAAVVYILFLCVRDTYTCDFLSDLSGGSVPQVQRGKVRARRWPCIPGVLEPDC